MQPATQTTEATYRELVRLCELYDALPREAIVKTDILRLGVAFTPAALKECAKAKPKSYFIFSFDYKTQEELSYAERHHAPEEIALVDGPWDLQRTIVSTRNNPESPYFVDVNTDNKLTLFCDGAEISQITLPQVPDYYNKELPNGKPVTDMTPTLQWGYLIYITAFRLCQYWGKEEECQFCDINENYRQQKKEGRSYTGIKEPEDIVQSLQIIYDNDPKNVSTAYTVTGGSITTELQGMKECEFYARYAQAIEEKFPKRWIGKAVVQAWEQDDCKTLKNAGYTIYHPNYEVWDKTLFEAICPGKTRYVGRDEWMKRIVDSAEVFGPENVIPNFVAGVEMAEPYGFKTIDEALASTGEGLDFFMSKGVCPRFTLWCIEPRTALYEHNKERMPLEYYVRLLQLYRDTHHKHGLPVPPGYGDPGVGKAVFSVSAFMDVL